jgi:hypothetical protein
MSGRSNSALVAKRTGPASCRQALRDRWAVGTANQTECGITWRRLAREGCPAQLGGLNEPVGQGEVLAGPVAIHYTQLILLPGFSFLMSKLLGRNRFVSGRSPWC